MFAVGHVLVGPPVGPWPPDSNHRGRSRGREVREVPWAPCVSYVVGPGTFSCCTLLFHLSIPSPIKEIHHG